VLLSCVTTGMHYFVDVLGGLIVTVIAIVATRPLCASLEPIRMKRSSETVAEGQPCEPQQPSSVAYTAAPVGVQALACIQQSEA
jgi:hypothetical protein